MKELERQIKNNPRLPKHVGIIMDGNGRWAKQRGLPRVTGHNTGIDSVREIVESCGELGIKVLSLYTFSKENWQRPRWEVSALMQLLVNTIRKEIDDLMNKNVRVICIGRLQDLPDATRKSMEDAITRTSKNTGLILNLALSYGARAEIRDAVVDLALKVKSGEIEAEDISDETISNHLQTAGLPDPDLIIRTSGEFRISNFLLWQIAYAEIYVTNTLWPDFRKADLLAALQNYMARERRFGKVTEQLVAENSVRHS